MEKYFIVTEESGLHKEHKEYSEFFTKMHKIAVGFMKKHGIEANEFYYMRDRFAIVPSSNDEINFNNMLKKVTKNGLRFFRQNSKVNKDWEKTVKDSGIEWKFSPWVRMYFDQRGGMASTRLFDIDGTVYCSLQQKAEINTPKGFIEIKASEFFKVIEDYEAKEGAPHD